MNNPTDDTSSAALTALLNMWGSAPDAAVDRPEETAPPQAFAEEEVSSPLETLEMTLRNFQA